MINVVTRMEGGGSVCDGYAVRLYIWKGGNGWLAARAFCEMLTQASPVWLHPLALVKLPWCVGVVATICSTDERHLERD